MAHLVVPTFGQARADVQRRNAEREPDLDRRDGLLAQH
jgi:hypothetical protein